MANVIKPQLPRFKLPFSLDRAPGNWSTAQIPDQSGRVHIVTGGSTGLGFETAKVLAQKNAHVLVAGRLADNTMEAGASKSNTVLLECRAANRIKLAVGSQKHVDTLRLDVSTFACVQESVEAFRGKDLPLHCLINNAGVSLPPDKRTSDGLEITQATNLFGPLYYTHLLLEWLAASPPARIVFVTSLTETHGSVDFSDVRGSKLKASDYRAYARSKLSSNMAARELQRRLRLAAPGVDVLLAQPGLANSGGASKADPAKFAAKATDLLGKVLAQAVEDGAKPLLHCATAPELEGHGGGNLVHGPLYGGLPYQFLGLFGIVTVNFPKVVAQPPLNALSRDAEACRRMYEEVMGVVREFTGYEGLRRC